MKITKRWLCHNGFTFGELYITGKVSKYGVIYGPYFLNTGKYGPEMSPYWNTFGAVIAIIPVQPRREGRNAVKMVNL